jgi:hypothetical protein
MMYIPDFSHALKSKLVQIGGERQVIVVNGDVDWKNDSIFVYKFWV